MQQGAPKSHQSIHPSIREIYAFSHALFFSKVAVTTQSPAVCCDVNKNIRVGRQKLMLLNPCVTFPFRPSDHLKGFLAGKTPLHCTKNRRGQEDKRYPYDWIYAVR